MGMPDERGRVEEIDIGGGDVHVTADQQITAGLLDLGPQRGQPGQLVPVVVVVHCSAVRHVRAGDPDLAAGRRYRPGFRLRQTRLVGQAWFRIL